MNNIDLNLNEIDWIEKCYQQYLIHGVSEYKAKLWARSTFFRLDCNLSKNPEKAADDDLMSWA
jgi:hypothetical protein